MKFLDDEERTRLRTQHKRERDGRVRDSIKAVPLYDKGWTYKQISEALLLTYEAIRNHIEEYRSQKKLREGLPEDEAICFTDGVHPTHNVQAAYGWIKKGVRKKIPANSGRSRLNLSGAVDVISHKVIIQSDKTLNADSTIQFLRDKSMYSLEC